MTKITLPRRDFLAIASAAFAASALPRAARAQGAQGFGPITAASDLAATFAKAIAAVDAGSVAVVDVRVEPGYTAAMTAAMTRKSE